MRLDEMKVNGKAQRSPHLLVTRPANDTSSSDIQTYTTPSYFSLTVLFVVCA